MADKPKPSAGPAATPDPEPTAQASGPGQPASPPPPEPKLVTVKWGEKELQMPEDLARTWQEREQAFDRKLSETGQELGQLRTFHKTYAPVVSSFQQPAKPAEPDLNTLWFENPAAAKDAIKKEVRAEIVGEYQRDQAIKTFWDGFYRKHDDLRDDDFLVEAVLQRNPGLFDLSVREAQEKLADLTRTEILRLSRKAKPTTDATPAAHPLTEAASGERAPSPPAEAPKRQTLSDLRARFGQGTTEPGTAHVVIVVASTEPFASSPPRCATSSRRRVPNGSGAPTSTSRRPTGGCSTSSSRRSRATTPPSSTCGSTSRAAQTSPSASSGRRRSTRWRRRTWRSRPRTPRTSSTSSGSTSSGR